jgi:hypothetical protein
MTKVPCRKPDQLATVQTAVDGVLAEKRTFPLVPVNGLHLKTYRQLPQHLSACRYLELVKIRLLAEDSPGICLPAQTWLRSGQRSEQILLAVRVGIGCFFALALDWGKAAHQLQSALVAFENILQFQALRAASLDGPNAIGLGIKQGMTRTLGVPFCGFDFQHDQTILFGSQAWREFGSTSHSAERGKVRVRSVLLFCFFLGPERRLNGASPLILEVCKFARPVNDAALGPRQPQLRLAELAFGVTQAPVPDFVELWIFAHGQSQT